MSSSVEVKQADDVEISEAKIDLPPKVQTNREGFAPRLVTAALPYINNVPHLGHLAGSHLPADIFARWSRMRGHETIFIGGSDEHGTPSELAAEKLGIPHAEFCDRLHKIHAEIYRNLGISYENYSRTSSPKHRAIVDQIFREIMKAGHIRRGEMEMFFDPEADRFLADRYVEGTCPNCGFEGASGDQCESCTSMLVTNELIDPKSTLTGTTPEVRTTEHLFLDLSAFQERLKEWVEGQTHWRPQVRNIAKAWLDDGLRERGITRDLKYGLPVPVEDMENKVLYVWFEAPIAYISFLAEVTEDWERFWGEAAARDTEIYHFLGKDNIPFHTIFWPAILMAAGRYRMPTHIAGMQYLNYQGGKFSKSKQRGVFCESMLDADVDPDLLRVYLALIAPETTDAEFSWDDMRTNVNAMLVNKASNLLHRSAKFATKKLGGNLERPETEELTDEDKTLIADVKSKLEAYEGHMEAVQIRRSIRTVFEIAELGNQYINDQAPWTALKDGDKRRAEVILYLCEYVVRTMASALSPFAPNTALRIWSQLGLSGSPASPETWGSLGALEAMPKMLELKEPEMMFARLTDETIADIRRQLSKITPIEDFFK